MSQIRANILIYLTRHGAQDAAVSPSTFPAKFAKLNHLEPGAVCAALDDLRHFGLIEITPSAVTLAAVRPSGITTA